MSSGEPIKWGVYHCWARMAMPDPAYKYVAVGCCLEDGRYGVLPISTQIGPMHRGTVHEACYVRLERGRYPRFITKKMSWLDANTVWAFDAAELTDYRGTLRPDDVAAAVACAKGSVLMRKKFQALLDVSTVWPTLVQ